jgi:hypothetical protein
MTYRTLPVSSFALFHLGSPQIPSNSITHNIYVFCSPLYLSIEEGTIVFIWKAPSFPFWNAFPRSNVPKCAPIELIFLHYCLPLRQDTVLEPLDTIKIIVHHVVKL